MLKKILNSYIFLILILSITGLLSYQLVKITYKKSKISKQLIPIQQEIEEIKEKKEDLAKMMDYYKTKDYLQKEARAKLNLKKEGEEVVIVVAPKKFKQARKQGEEVIEAENNGVQTQDSQKREPSNTTLWWQYFFK